MAADFLPYDYDRWKCNPPDEPTPRACPNCGSIDYESWIVIEIGTDKGNGYCSDCMSRTYDWYDCDAEIPEANR